MTENEIVLQQNSNIYEQTGRIDYVGRALSMCVFTDAMDGFFLYKL